MSPNAELSREEFAHESRHGHQWAAFGAGFIPLWLGDSAQAWVRHQLSGDNDCDAERFMLLEIWAGLDDGNYKHDH